MLERKTILAKLLAKENLEVIQGNYRTAAFDVVNRKLMLPLWKEMSNDVYDLLVGHEVGHALFTPSEGWHESDVKFDYPRSYINIVEDIRIEREVLKSYPGLVANFKRGYRDLFEDGFFGITEDQIEDMGFMDRLNIKAKMRDIVAVPFNDDEIPYFDMAMAANTFEEVLAACQAIYDFLKDKKEEQNEEENSSEQGNGGEGDPSDYDDSSEDSDQTDSEQGGSQKETEEDDSADESSAPSKGNVKSNSTAFRSDTHTDDSFRQNEGKLVEQDKNGVIPMVVSLPDRAEVTDAVVSYKETLLQRRDNEAKINRSDYQSYRWYWGSHEEIQKKIRKIEQDFVEFSAQTKKVVNSMAKEFEMRKAAYQNTRATTAKSGALDVTKLHNYKFSDDIFLRTTKLADAKSHGLFMMIDFSGSMGDVIKNVVDQAIVTATFCKKVGIPFEVYSFTSRGGCGKRKNFHYDRPTIDVSNTSLVQVLSSTMKNPEFKEAVEGLYKSHRLPEPALCDSMGATPTVEALSMVNFLMRDFMNKHKVQKPIFVMISDGDPSGVNIHSREYGRDIKIKFGDKYIRMNNSSGTQDAMISELKSQLGVKTLCYFIVSSKRHANQRFYRSHNSEELKKEFRANGLVVEKNKRGFDAWFTIDGSVDAVDEEFEVKDNAKKGDIARAFKKFANSKKTNRSFATKFAQAIS